MQELSLVDYFVLPLSSFLAGAMNSLAGGGTLLTFPALATVNDKEVANATSTIVLLPGSVAGAWGYRQEMKQEQGWIALLLWPSFLGGILGALLLVFLPKGIFGHLIPWLILLAALLFIAQPTIVKWTGKRSSDGAAPPSRLGKWFVVVFQFFIAIYGGYFGAGIGILMLSSLGLMGLTDIHRMNGVKTVLASSINLIAAVVFVFKDLVFGATIDWRVVPLMMLVAIAGGYLGARGARKINRNVVRWLVIVIGLGLAGYYFFDQYVADKPAPVSAGSAQVTS